MNSVQDSHRSPIGEKYIDGITLVHDRERAHNVLVRENGLAGESYTSRTRGTRSTWRRWGW